MNKFLVFIWLIGLTFSLHAQDFDNYKTVRSTGLIPEKFLISSTEKYKKESKEKILSEDKRHVRKAKDRFFLESNFAIDELLLSGKVLFNDPLTVYVNKVMDEVLKSEPELRNEIEVYVIKTASVNAFTTNNGFVFVCMGLLAQLENEAQLAYILSHEVIHYKKQHALDKYVEVTNIERGEGKYRYQSYDDKLLAKSNYSKEKETESDVDGLDIYLKTEYDINTLDGVFDVLEYAHLPFEDVEFEKNFLETETLIFPDDYFLKKVNEIEPIEYEEDEEDLGTHPAVQFRRETIAEKLEGKESANRKKYIISEEEFKKIQKISRYEIATEFLQQREYENAFYVAYILLKENPSSIYLQKIILKSLYGLSTYYDAGRYFAVHYDYEEMEGHLQQVYHLFSKLSSKELNATALSYALKLEKQHPNDIEIREIKKELFASMVTNYFTSIDELSKTPPLKTIEKTQLKKDSIIQFEPPSEVKEPKSKYEKIRAKKKKEEKFEYEVDDTTDIAKYAFVYELKDTSFTNEFARQAEIRDQKNAENELGTTKKMRRKKKREDKMNKNRGYALGLNKVIFLSPFYYKVNQEKNDLQRIDSEKAQSLLHEKLEQNAKLTGLNYEILDKKDLEQNAVEVFNDLALLNDFIDLTFQHDDIEMINHNREELLNLSKKYNTRYFCWTGVVSVKKMNLMKYLANCYSFTIYPLLPYLIYRIVRPTYTTSLYTLVLDAETGKVLMINKNDYKFSDRPDVLNSAIYDLCIQLKNERKN